MLKQFICLKIFFIINFFYKKLVFFIGLFLVINLKISGKTPYVYRCIHRKICSILHETITR